MIFQISKKKKKQKKNKQTNKQTKKTKNDKMILSLAWNNMFTDN